MSKRIYIAGPMRGYREYNFPAFRRAAALLRALGLDVICPAEKDVELDGFDPTQENSELDQRHYAKRDTEFILGCDAIYLLRGWSKSTGAIAEAALAKWIGLDFMFEDEYESQATLEVGS